VSPPVAVEGTTYRRFTPFFTLLQVAGARAAGVSHHLRLTREPSPLTPSFPVSTSKAPSCHRLCWCLQCRVPLATVQPLLRALRAPTRASAKTVCPSRHGLPCSLGWCGHGLGRALRQRATDPVVTGHGQGIGPVATDFFLQFLK
jgi:hypothetical protein